jgi:hypothetical protein
MGLLPGIQALSAAEDLFSMFLRSDKSGRKTGHSSRKENTGEKQNGADGSRTHDLLHAMQALSQLSYGPGCCTILAQAQEGGK